MARFLLAWELGGNLGHLAHLLPVALSLRERGHEVMFCVRDFADAAPLLAKQNFTVLHAPDMRPRRQSPVTTFQNYASVLAFAGFDDVERLSLMLRAWRDLYVLARPDVVVADHAPAAVTAARTLAIPTVIVGCGFVVPPIEDPFPNFRSGKLQRDPTEQLPDRSILRSVNAALADVGAAPLNALSDIVRAQGRFVFNFRALDHYPSRAPGDVGYVGYVSQGLQATSPEWPEGTKRVVAYLRPNIANVQGFLEELAQTDLSVVCYAPGLDLASLPEPVPKRIHFTPQPIDLTRLGQSADLGITYGSPGATTALLLNGVPVFMVPQQLEQYMFAWRVTSLRAGRLVPRLRGKGDRELVSAFASDARVREGAAAIKLRYGRLDAPRAFKTMIDRMEHAAT